MNAVQQRIRFAVAAVFSLGMVVLGVGGMGVASAATAQRTVPAHAAVLSAIPAIGSTIAQAPTTVTVFTAENINPDPKKSNLFVYGPTGEATASLISQGNATVSLSNPKQMSVTIKPDPKHSDGVYIVHWITVSALDGDPDEGAFTFTVKTGAAATPAASPTASTNTSTTPGTNSGGAGGAPIWAVILVGAVALVVGLGGGFGLGRRRASTSSLGGMRKSIQQERGGSSGQP
jgi:methionine-rich copper-binding protein CopC